MWFAVYFLFTLNSYLDAKHLTGSKVELCTYIKYIHFHTKITLRSKDLLYVENQRRNVRNCSKEVRYSAQQKQKHSLSVT